MNFIEWVGVQQTGAPNLYLPTDNEHAKIQKITGRNAYKFYLNNCDFGTITVFISAFEDDRAMLDREFVRLCQENNPSHYSIDKDGVFLMDN